jgi:hypothetical protein
MSFAWRCGASTAASALETSSTPRSHVNVHRRSVGSFVIVFAVAPICSALQLARSTYYAASHQTPSPRRRSEALLKPELVRVHAASYGV